MLNYIGSLYQQNSKSSVSLIRLGIILHIFADTYSHQNFSGYWGWENSTKIIKVIDNITNKDVTSKYRSRITENLPSIGHSNISTVPDESNISFTINFRETKDDIYYKKEYTRNNTTEFLLASRNILNYLRLCKKGEPISDCHWLSLEENLKKGFLTTYGRVKSLTDHWSKIFSDVEFHYNLENLTRPSDNYFDFNIYAYEIRKIILGNKEFPLDITYSNFNIDLLT